ncbi:MAG: type II toxin-antitoxin system HicB family antitoxin [Methylocella sp.]
MAHYVGILDGSDDNWGVRIPDVPGCVGAGNTPDEAIASVTGALRDVMAHKANGSVRDPDRKGRWQGPYINQALAGRNARSNSTASREWTPREGQPDDRRGFCLRRSTGKRPGESRADPNLWPAPRAIRSRRNGDPLK